MKANETRVSEQNDCEILARTYIAAPCSVPWDSMSGDERIRFCNQCELNVYNISEMSEKEAASTIRQSEGRLCLRFYRRSDGTILTENCPVGLRRVRNWIRVAAVASLTPLIWFGLLDAAHAQGLVGAPVNGLYGVSGQSNYVPPQPTVSPEKSIVLATTATICSGWLISQVIRKRSSIMMIGGTLAIVLGVVGFLVGFLPQGN